jgi:hypothetical protein
VSAILILIIVVAVVALAGGGVLALRRANPSRALPAPRGAARGDVTLFNLEIGDVIEHAGTSYVVESTLRYEAGGYRWTEHLLVTGSAPDEDRWLTVEEDDRVEVQLLAKVRGLDAGAAGTPPPRSLEWQGVSYAVEEDGHAMVTRVRAERPDETHQVAFWDYGARGGEVLSIEDWGNEREVTAGRKVLPASLLLLPGSGRPLLGDGT